MGFGCFDAGARRGGGDATGVAAGTLGAVVTGAAVMWVEAGRLRDGAAAGARRGERVECVRSTIPATSRTATASAATATTRRLEDGGGRRTEGRAARARRRPGGAGREGSTGVGASRPGGERRRGRQVGERDEISPVVGDSEQPAALGIFDVEASGMPELGGQIGAGRVDHLGAGTVQLVAGDRLGPAAGQREGGTVVAPLAANEHGAHGGAVGERVRDGHGDGRCPSSCGLVTLLCASLVHCHHETQAGGGPGALDASRHG